jgi:hypothetical protein
MEKEFIPYTLALDLKELGFDEPCFGYYTGDKKHLVLRPNVGRRNEDLNDIVCTSPLYQQAFRWFRETYNLSNCIESHYTDEWFYFYKIEGKDRNYSETQDYDNHEEAELECLKKLIEITKNTNK